MRGNDRLGQTLAVFLARRWVAVGRSEGTATAELKNDVVCGLFGVTLRIRRMLAHHCLAI
ncbi:hypothetical protein BTW07_14605 [Salinicola socius]|uniref:Uncharacterized protein n=1 Tax=Salinicola socius TaxID=404433 RepID=A0A1Q8SPE7_9GAMM|nr:hypothetical protein BTW07_14605 [Salinicola socius]